MPRGSIKKLDMRNKKKQVLTLSASYVSITKQSSLTSCMEVRFLASLSKVVEIKERGKGSSSYQIESLMGNSMGALRSNSPGPKGELGVKGEMGRSGERGQPGQKGERGDPGMTGEKGDRYKKCGITAIKCAIYCRAHSLTFSQAPCMPPPLDILFHVSLSGQSLLTFKLI
uniref:Collagen IV NC1 domain-containing protein n=1 Tax=Glossina palpalis gambiensis TaxID=67801 RepID=A0A1B0AW80_9MUSC